jgi:hypothetical protein
MPTPISDLILHCTLGLSFILTWNFNKIQTVNDSYWQNNTFFVCCKVSENVLFSEHMHSKCVKSANADSKLG